MSKSYIFSSESVGEGHPDKVCDTISDYVLDACLEADPTSRVACECYAKSNVVIVGGEITIPKIKFQNPSEAIDFIGLTRKAIADIGYTNDDDVFHANKVFVNCLITGQSPDIAQGVDARKAEGKKTAKQGAGDQGLMFGYACDETEELMPAPIMYAHRLGRKLTEIRKTGKVKWLRPDATSRRFPCSTKTAGRWGSPTWLFQRSTPLMWPTLKSRSSALRRSSRQCCQKQCSTPRRSI